MKRFIGILVVMFMFSSTAFISDAASPTQVPSDQAVTTFQDNSTGTTTGTTDPRTNSPGTTTGPAGTTTNYNNGVRPVNYGANTTAPDRRPDYGWLGLLGLAGLFGFARRRREDI